MSGIYIPEIAAPKSCNKCYEIGLVFAIEKLGLRCPHRFVYYSPTEEDIKGIRRSDCPIINIPPHGRLGDLDALWEKAFEKWGTEYDPWVMSLFMDMISGAPTIIPADPEKEATKV